jgi:hypothetical protein
MDTIIETPAKTESRFARYYKNNSARCIQIQKNYYYRNADKRRAYQREYDARKRAEKRAAKQVEQNTEE